MTGLALGELCGELSAHAAELCGDPAQVVRDVEQDSRRVRPGALFAARRGAASDGARFAADAVARGAVAVLADAGARLPELSCPVLRVRDVGQALSHAAEAVHGWPSKQLSLVGVTGTNGKTTVVWLVSHLLEAQGVPCARIGTLGVEALGESGELGLTTPQADTTSRWLARVVAGGGRHAVMEVSSVALVSGRVEALRFDVAAFSNLTRDHLDDHGSFEAYGEAKARLFLDLAPRAAVINLDDPFGRGLCGRVGSALRVSAGGGEVEVDTSRLAAGALGISGGIAISGRRYALDSPLLGQHNVENLGLALGIVAALGLDVKHAVAALSRIESAPGRLERCDGPADDCRVLVDYAHTPDALERVLSTLRAIAPRRLICVFGCGGDRDGGKREPMGRAAGRHADWVVLTNDNPRSESPERIAEAVERGLRAEEACYEVCLDRARAIERAVASAGAGDLVLIAGKGHETYQITGDGRIDFDDREHARRALAARRRGHGGGSV